MDLCLDGYETGTAQIRKAMIDSAGLEFSGVDILGQIEFGCESTTIVVIWYI
jgi:hypothetical protein